MSNYTVNNAIWIGAGNDPFALDEATLFLPGQLGHISSLQNTTGIDPGSGPKIIQCVKRYATDTVAMVAGNLAFWQDTDNFVITGEVANAIGGTTFPLLAGVFGAATPSAGNHGYIQVGGVSPLRVSDSTSASTTAQGKNFIWSTNSYVKQATTNADGDDPVVAVLRLGNNATTTNLLVEGLLKNARHSW